VPLFRVAIVGKDRIGSDCVLCKSVLLLIGERDGVEWDPMGSFCLHAQQLKRNTGRFEALLQFFFLVYNNYIINNKNDKSKI
jgi:hypothetical protein